jgi:hypothetical protein
MDSGMGQKECSHSFIIGNRNMIVSITLSAVSSTDGKFYLLAAKNANGCIDGWLDV